MRRWRPSTTTPFTLSILLALALGGCGGDDGPPTLDDGGADGGGDDGGRDDDAGLDGGSDAGPPDETGPEVTLRFPSPVSQVAAATVLVRGSARDASGVATVRVNDVSASSTDDFASFEARVSLEPGDNTLTIVAVDALGNESEPTELTVRREALLGTLFSLDVDPSGVVYGIDHRRDEVVRVDLASAQTRVVSASSDGADHPFAGAIGLAYDTRRSRILVANRAPAQILAVDPTTGARTVLSDGTIGDSPTPLRLPSRITIDPEGDRAFVLETSATGTDGRLLSVALETGAITMVRADAVSASPPLAGATAMDFDLASGRVLVMNRDLDALLAIDPTDGSARIVSDNFAPTSGTGVAPFTNTVSLRIDPTAGVAYAHEIEQRQILAIDLTTGTRRRIGDADLAMGDVRIADSRDFVIDGGRLVLFETTDPKIVAIDLATGARSTLDDRSFPSGQARLRDAVDLAFDPRRGTLYVANLERLTAVDLATGERRDVADELDYLAGVAMDEARDRVLALDATAGLLAFDPEDGSSVVLSDDSTGEGDAFTSVQRIFVDVERDRYLVRSSDTLLEVDPGTGDRTTIEGDSLLDLQFDVAFDAARDRILATGRVDSGVGSMPAFGLVAIDVVSGAHSLVAYSLTDESELALFYGLGVRGDVLYAGGYVDEGPSVLFQRDLVAGTVRPTPFADDGLARGEIGRSIAARLADGYERLYLVHYAPGRTELLQVDPTTNERVVIAR